jgi:hypothetical protein
MVSILRDTAALTIHIAINVHVWWACPLSIQLFFVPCIGYIMCDIDKINKQWIA